MKNYGIHNARQLRDADDNVIKKKMGITGVRLLQELRGIPCYTLEHSPSPKKGITVSRTFRNAIESLDDLKEAIAAYVSIGADNIVIYRIHYIAILSICIISVGLDNMTFVDIKGVIRK